MALNFLKKIPFDDYCLFFTPKLRLLAKPKGFFNFFFQAKKILNLFSIMLFSF